MSRKHMILVILLLLCLPLFCHAEETAGRLFDEPSREYTVTEKEGLVIPVDFKGTPVRNVDHKAQSDKYFVYYLDEQGIHVYPVAKGKATITLTNKSDKKDKTVITVTVDESAVDGKSEEAPLRAFAVLDQYEAVQGDSVTGRYVILGGSGKYPDVSVNAYVTDPNNSPIRMGSEYAKIQQGKGKGTFTVKAFTEMDHAVYVCVSVVDSDGHRCLVYSNPVLFTPLSSIGVVCDTTFINVPAGSEIHCKYFTYSDNPIKSGKMSIDVTSEKKLQKIGAENPLDLKASDEKQEQIVMLEIRDSKNHFAGFRLSWSTEDDWYLALKCDRPVAAVGDEVHFTVESENVPASVLEELDPLFFCYQYTGEGKMFELAVCENVRRTPDGFTLVCDMPGIIYIGAKGALNTAVIVR